jgi:hypothetical protein
MTEKAQPRTAFEWPLYVDATLAGLSVLIPILILDWLIEERFRRRMPAAVARHRRRTLSRDVIRVLNTSSGGCLTTGFGLLLRIPLEILKHLSRRILFGLTLNDAAYKLSYYWQRAFLLDYMLACGHLDTMASAFHARLAMEDALRTAPTHLTRLARLVLQNTHHIGRILRRVRGASRRGTSADDALAQQRATMRGQWAQYEADLRALAERYDHMYQARIGAQVAR